MTRAPGETATDNGINNSEGILGIIDITPAAPSTFDLLNRMGGNGNDGFHGILELSGFLYAGGRTTSTDVLLTAGADPGFAPVAPFNADSGGIDGLLGRVPLGGNAWRGLYFGGTGNEVINNLAPFLEGVFIFGSTTSIDDSLPTSNIGRAPT